MNWHWLYNQETILFMHKVKILTNAERKEALRKSIIRKGFINKKHNLVRGFRK